jgi:hypothetical protein
MTTTITPPNAPAFKNAFEYAARWRNKHDAVWVANEVWNKVHGPNGYGSTAWQGFSVEDYRLTTEEAALYQFKIDAAIVAKQERVKREEEYKLAQEAHKKMIAIYEKCLEDKDETKIVMLSEARLEIDTNYDQDEVRQNSTDWLDAQDELVLETMGDLGFEGEIHESFSSCGTTMTRFRFNLDIDVDDAKFKSGVAIEDQLEEKFKLIAVQEAYGYELEFEIDEVLEPSLEDVADLAA